MKSDFLYNKFVSSLTFEPTDCQKNMFQNISEFIGTDEDIMVINGYAGTGKTTAISAVIKTLNELKINTILLAPTGRSAKVLASYCNKPAYTIHKHIYRQNSISDDGMGKFALDMNKSKETLFIVDEVSLIGADSLSTSSFGSGNLLEDLVLYIRNGVNCKLILMGDSSQLPPIGLDISPALDRSFMTFLSCSRFVELTSVVRQAKESGILLNATHLRELISEESFIDKSELALMCDEYSDVERISGMDLIETISDAYSKYGTEETVVLCRSNKRAIRYNMGIRSKIQYCEAELVRGDKLMIVKNCYQFLEDVKELDYIANGDVAVLEKISKFEELHGFHFAQARLCFPDYNDVEINAKVILDTLQSESPSLNYEQQQQLYQSVNESYSYIRSKKKRWEKVREDVYFNALQLKYANAITCHKSQGGQWDCVFIDNPFYQDDLSIDDLKWLYTAFTRAKKKVYLVNFKDEMFLNI